MIKSRILEFLFGKNPKLFKGGNYTKQLSKTQELFCQWNAERLNISIEQSRARYLKSLKATRNGHGGARFRDFCDLSHEIFIPFFDDNEKEVFDTYSFHGYLHFLRMLSNKEPKWSSDHPVIKGVSDLSSVTILDFGCGLAQHSRYLADYFTKEGKNVHLVLTDIPTIRKPFLMWLAEKTGIKTTFIDCTAASPIPKLPSCNVCIATEIFEHLHDPIPYFHEINGALHQGGFLLTNISDHPGGFMHLSPKLNSLRDELIKFNYDEIIRYKLFKKR
jgi:SAM-dependent methyltransferase